MRKSKARNETVRVRFTRAELETARRNAASEGVPLSTYLRRLAVTAGVSSKAEEERVKRALAAFDALSGEEVEAIRDNVRDVREAWNRGRR